MRLRHTSTAMALALFAMGAPAWADMEAAKAFLDTEIGDLSTLSRADQEAEMQWFIDAAKPYAGMDIKVVSETIDTHVYESKVLAPAFTEITGIKITHDLIGEGDVVEKLQTQMQSGENIYDAYINDSDLIGTHWRYQQVRNLTDWMAGEGKDVTSPTLDLAGLHRHEVHDRARRQALPAARPAVREPLLVPLRLVHATRRPRTTSRPSMAMTSAFRSTGRPMRTSPSSSPGATCPTWAGRPRSMATWTTARRTPRSAGATPTRGCPWPAWATRASRTACRSMNGASAWTRTRRPVGSCVARGGATNDAAAVYAVTKAIEWLQKYSPPEAQGMVFGEAGPVPAQGAIAQQMFWYTAFTADIGQAAELPVMNEDGTPKWRMAPSPHGAYWSEGTKIGYQDVGSWTLMQSTPVDRAQAAWLYAQFVTSKTVDLKKSRRRADLHPRKSTIDSQHFTDRAPETRRPDRVLPLARPRRMVAHRHQHPGLSEDGAALVAEHRRRHVG